jgi:hypothetical protein
MLAKLGIILPQDINSSMTFEIKLHQDTQNTHQKQATIMGKYKAIS